MMTNEFHHIQCGHTGEGSAIAMKEEDCDKAASK